MSAIMNIAGLTPVDDPSYRYKMPRITAKVEGRGNGIKTLLSNVFELGPALNRDAAEITKFFGCELGSQTTFSQETERAIVNGSHTAQLLQDKLKLYIEHFVLCKECHYPETHYKIKSGLISQKCLACGNVSGVDMTHKLTTFILAQHKKAKEVASALASAKPEKEKKKKDKKVTDTSEGGASATSPSAAGTATDTHEPKSEKKAKKDKKEKSSDEATAAAGDVSATGEKKKKSKDKEKEKSSSKSKDKSGDAAATGEEATPVKEKKSKSSKSHSSSDSAAVPANVFGIQSAPPAADDDESDRSAAEESFERFRRWCADNADAPMNVMLEELRCIQTFAALRPADRIIIYLGSKLTDAVLKNKEIEEHRTVLAALASSLIQQRHLIAAFEWFCGTRHPVLLRYFPVVLKALYELDLVEEDVLLVWSTDLTRNEFSSDPSMIDLDTLEQLRTAAKPFIHWLEEAEDDDDGEEDDNEDEEEEEDEEEGSDENEVDEA